MSRNDDNPLLQIGAGLGAVLLYVFCVGVSLALPVFLGLLILDWIGVVEVF